MRPKYITCARPGCESTKAVGKRGPIPRYCSARCRVGVAHDRREVIRCTACAKSATVRPGTKYCSPRCRDTKSYTASRADGRYDAMLRRARLETERRRRANIRPCPYCAGPMLPPKTKHCGEDRCKRAFNAERGREWQRQYREQTGQWYRQARYADEQRQYERQRRAVLGSSRKRYPAAAAAGDARRRMRMQQARTADVFAPADVHTRDGWTCQLCLLPIDPEVAWPDPMSASVDHIVPLARVGRHSMANVQSAHLGCNCRKGDRLPTGAAVEQPSLIG